MKKRRVLAAIMTATLALSLAGCGGSSGDSKSSGSSDSSVANADKPLCWFNRQPSNSSTGELDKGELNCRDRWLLTTSKLMQTRLTETVTE